MQQQHCVDPDASRYEESDVGDSDAPMPDDEDYAPMEDEKWWRVL